jgi:hypothetical protein
MSKFKGDFFFFVCWLRSNRIIPEGTNIKKRKIKHGMKVIGTEERGIVLYNVMPLKGVEVLMNEDMLFEKKAIKALRQSTSFRCLTLKPTTRRFARPTHSAASRIRPQSACPAPSLISG